MVVSSSETRLPLPLTSLIGRRAEIEGLRHLLTSGARLVTLTGPGGVGKTRLALEATAQSANAFADGVFFVPLQALTEEGLVLAEIASVLRVRESGTRPLIDDLCAALADKQALLCIDNWEHVLGAAPQLASLLMVCRRLHVVATSREALRLQGEHEYPVSPLGVPIQGQPHPVDIVQPEAVQLFIDRAKAVKSGFEVDNRRTAAIGEICTVLDGLPLAIELAAALMRLFSPEALLTRLKSSPGLAGRSPSMQLLAGGPRDLAARQQTLRATIEWSYNLLDFGEQRLFRRLAIFAGGCDLEAVEAVCTDVDPESRPILDLLIALVDKNLLRAREVDGEPRFELLRTIQEYAAEQLLGCGELHNAQRRHADYYLGLAEQARQEFVGPRRIYWLERLEREHDNFRSVLTWSLAHGQAETAFRLGGSVWILWAYRGHDREGRQWLTRIAAMEGNVAPAERAKVLNRAAQFEYQQGDLGNAERHLAEAKLLVDDSQDRRGMVEVITGLGHVAYLRNDFEAAIAYWHESLDLERDLGADPFRISGKLGLLAAAMRGKRDLVGALELGKQAMSLVKDLGDPTLLAEASLTLGEVALAQEEYAQAIECARTAKDLSIAAEDTYAIAWADQILGWAALNSENLSEAEHCFIASLKRRHDLNDTQGITESLEGLACLAAACKALERAARLWGAAEAFRRSLGALPADSDRPGYERYIRVARAQLREKAFLTAKNTGAEMSIEQAVRYAQEIFDIGEDKPVKGATRRSYPAGLTAREVEVLALVAQGLSDAEVAQRLVLSPRTVNAHLTSIYNKLGVNSRVAATRFAIDQNLVEDGTNAA